MAEKNTRIAESFMLPSHGAIYDEEVNPQIVLGSMKTKHEMLRLSATEDSQKLMADIIDDCMETDPGISSYDMCLGDFQYLLYKLRVVTYGPDYEMVAICPRCGFENTISVNLDELPVKEFSEDLLDRMSLTLPVSGHEVTLTLQTPRTLDRINKKAREYQRRHKDSNENATILYTITTSIETWDGEKPSPILDEEIKELDMADTNALIHRIDDINDEMGVELEMEDTCDLCLARYRVPFRVTDEFFRPSVK